MQKDESKYMDVAFKKLVVLKDFKQYHRKIGGKKYKDLREFILLYRKNNPHDKHFSVSTFRRWEADCKKHGIKGLIPKYSYRYKFHPWPTSAKAFLLSRLSEDPKTPLSIHIRALREMGKIYGWNLPKNITIRRYIKRVLSEKDQ